MISTYATMRSTRFFKMLVHQNGIKGKCDGVPIKLFRKYAILSSYNGIPYEKISKNPAKIKILPEQDVDHFKSYFPMLVEDLTQTNLITDVHEMKERLKISLEYNITSGKQNRPLMLIAAYKYIVGQKQLPEEKFRDVALMAWCIELISSYILMMDDIVDNSETRRGNKAWFKFENVGLSAINDATIIQMSVFKLLEKYFSSFRYYQDIYRVFVEVILKTFVGQAMDCEKCSCDDFSMEKYNKIAFNKTGYYSFYFPLVNAMYLADRPDLELETQGFDVFMELGRFYQIQNDFHDIYGESYSGKLGTDIQEGKQSWLIIKALELASSQQKEILRNCYGKLDDECVKQVKLVYAQLKMGILYEKEVQKIYEKILKSISGMKNESSKALLLYVVRLYLGYDSFMEQRMTDSRKTSREYTKNQ